MESRTKQVGEIEGQRQEHQPDENWVHPLDRPEIRTFLEKLSTTNEIFTPDLITALQESQRPMLSPSPTEEEYHEAALIQRIREKSGLESTGQWIQRLLYEETFGIGNGDNQLFTIGGLLSHHWKMYSKYDPLKTNSLLRGFEIKPKDLSFQEAIEKIDRLKQTDKLDWQIKDLLIDQLIQLGIPLNHQDQLSRRYPQMYSKSLSVLSEHPLLKTPMQNGWKILQTVDSVTKEILEPVYDDQLTTIQFMGPNKAVALRSIWYKLGSKDSPIFVDPPQRRLPDDPLFPEGLRQLAILRTSPDLTFLYSHFSAEGSINERKEV